jgi:hypothetical protein
MKRFLIMAVVGVLALGFSSTASANYCSFDAVPSATLLFPFVVFDYDGEFGGQTTQMAITNTSAEAQIVHITVWSDFSVAILDFNLTMTGYDVTRMNIRDILALGYLPTEDADTGRKENIWVDDNSNAGGTPLDWGPYSSHNQLHDPVVSLDDLPDPDSTTGLDCDPDDWISSPVNYVERIGVDTLNLFEGYLRASQTATKDYLDCDGASVTFDEGDPWFVTRDDGPAWMYVTADVVASCNKDLPDASPGTYFNGDRAATNGVIDDNVLIGDVIYLGNATASDGVSSYPVSEADQAVHLESRDPANYPFLGQVPTFYFRYTLLDPALTAGDDGREPLPNAWAIRYQLIENINVDTWIRVFKASSLFRTVTDLSDDDTLPIDWGNISDPSPSELYASACYPYTVYAWDEDENVNSVTTDEDPFSGTQEEIRPIPNLFPLETQEVNIENLFIVRKDTDEQYFGWLLFVWPGSNLTPPPVDPTAPLQADWYQTWVGARYSGFDQYSAALTGAVMANYNCDQNQVLPQLGIGQELPTLP